MLNQIYLFYYRTMEKLIELLNEYEFKVADTYNYAEREVTEDDLERLSERIISKKYWFIQWLVENDKIDKSKVFSFIDTADKPYEDILCLLALSDEPISDLISFLKDD